LSRRVDVHRLAVNKHCCKTFAEERSAIKLQSDDDLACLVDEAVLATINHQRQTFGKTIRVFPLRRDHHLSRLVNKPVLVIHLYDRQALLEVIGAIELRLNNDFARCVYEADLFLVGETNPLFVRLDFDPCQTFFEIRVPVVRDGRVSFRRDDNLARALDKTGFPILLGTPGARKLSRKIFIRKFFIWLRQSPHYGLDTDRTRA
jgi:hypothetical protein